MWLVSVASVASVAKVVSVIGNHGCQCTQPYYGKTSPKDFHLSHLKYLKFKAIKHSTPLDLRGRRITFGLQKSRSVVIVLFSFPQERTVDS